MATKRFDKQLHIMVTDEQYKTGGELVARLKGKFPSIISRIIGHMNVSGDDDSSGGGNVSVFIDDGSLVGWWRMDDVNSSGDVTDYSGQCYDNETKILTENGWKLFEDLNKDERVMTLNQESGESEWQLPTDYLEFDNSELSGEMFKIKLESENGKDSELIVSEKHRVYSSSLKSLNLTSIKGSLKKKKLPSKGMTKSFLYLNSSSEIIFSPPTLTSTLFNSYSITFTSK